MSGDVDAGHLAAELLGDYYAGSLGEDEQMRIEEHLADCSRCTEHAQQVRQFARLLDSWTARAHGQAQERAALARGLQTAQERAPDAALGERLARWAQAWGRQAAATLRVLVAAPDRASRTLAAGLMPPLPPAAPGPLARLAPAAAVPPIRGRRLARPRGAAAARVGLGPGEAQASVRIEGTGMVVVRLEALPTGQRPPLVLLLDADGAEPRVGLPRREPGLPFWVARFEDVAPGAYLVAIEPIAEPAP